MPALYTHTFEVPLQLISSHSQTQRATIRKCDSYTDVMEYPFCKIYSSEGRIAKERTGAATGFKPGNNVCMHACTHVRRSYHVVSATRDINHSLYSLFPIALCSRHGQAAVLQALRTCLTIMIVTGINILCGQNNAVECRSRV